MAYQTAEVLARYPKNWKEISRRVIAEAGNRCAHCGAENGKPNKVTGKKTVLQCAHYFDHNPENCSPENLKALCKRCHSIHDQKIRAEKVATGKITGDTMEEKRATRKDPPIRCSHSAVIPIEDLRANPRNPNRHPHSQIQRLGKIIEATGWRTPITVSARSGYIVRGHGRYAAARFMGFKMIPVDYQDYTSDAEETADLIADNKIAELSELDGDMIDLLTLDLQAEGFDMEIAGFEPPTQEEAKPEVLTLDELLEEYTPPKKPEKPVWFSFRMEKDPHGIAEEFKALADKHGIKWASND